MRRVLLSIAATAVLFVAPGSRTVGSQAPERALFGDFPGRNSISPEKGLPTTWDVETGANILWTEPTGSQSYAGPVVAGGRVADRSQDRAARAIIAQELGHGRVEVLATYVGSAR